MKLLVAVKRVMDYNARVRVKPDKVRLHVTKGLGVRRGLTFC
jgi:electron transfer flavoprotein alpha/beta subunit